MMVTSHMFDICYNILLIYLWLLYLLHETSLVMPHVGWGCHGLDHMVVGFTITCAISAYHHYNCELEPCSWRCVLDTTLGYKVFQ